MVRDKIINNDLESKMPGINKPISRVTGSFQKVRLRKSKADGNATKKINTEKVKDFANKKSVVSYKDLDETITFDENPSKTLGETITFENNENKNLGKVSNLVTLEDTEKRTLPPKEHEETVTLEKPENLIQSSCEETIAFRGEDTYRQATNNHKETTRFPNANRGVKKITFCDKKNQKNAPDKSKSLSNKNLYNSLEETVNFSKVEKTPTRSRLKKPKNYEDFLSKQPGNFQINKVEIIRSLYSKDSKQLETNILLDSLGHYWKKFVLNIRKYASGIDLEKEIYAAFKLLEVESEGVSNKANFHTLLGDFKTQIMSIAKNPLKSKNSYLPLVKSPELIESPNEICDIVIRYIALVLYCLKNQLEKKHKVVIAMESEDDLAILFENCKIPCRFNPKERCRSKEIFRYLRRNRIKNITKDTPCCSLFNPERE